ncbi:EamA family transporter RarD [Vibrio vulnificus]|uniref:EamA family transporter RarD n=1 Tax=Vibrio vulnificus TaxID=672 RepID=UPI000CD2C624|nr:EamA family transporter RarD [Vibrio vulnificus]EHD0096908.1 EamA family transporter RarD [Vibrio vulnificus]EHD1695891.1 EamA family transporter RarD [Vibrio vulnificus]EHU4975084.1 EamA family transporter RarD [Vibrio vulnificus]EHU9472004.1 EamA family transporter RarD [Vibrio vulnificus]EIZ1360068.1 EamA family transporter RarD [Vibrio vulnificus]
MKTTSYGNIMAAISFLIWGLTPIYYRLMPSAQMDELLAMRIIASVPVGLVLVYFITGKLPEFRRVWHDKRSLLYTLIAALLMCISWSTFTWALTNDRVIDASLGFFISPLMMVALGVLVLKETLSPGKKLAIFFAALGLGYQIVHYGEIPYVALTMGVFFTLYGFCKKKIAYDWSTTLFFEALLLAPVATIYMAMKYAQGDAVSLSSDLSMLLLYLGSGPVTIAPLIFYSIAIRYTNMTNIGLMQYIEPTLQFLLAVFIFAEYFDQVKMVSFGLIWFGLLLTIAETLANRVKRRSVRLT